MQLANLESVFMNVILNVPVNALHTDVIDKLSLNPFVGVWLALFSTENGGLNQLYTCSCGV